MIDYITLGVRLALNCSRLILITLLSDNNQLSDQIFLKIFYFEVMLNVIETGLCNYMMIPKLKYSREPKLIEEYIIKGLPILILALVGIVLLDNNIKIWSILIIVCAGYIIPLLGFDLLVNKYRTYSGLFCINSIIFIIGILIFGVQEYEIILTISCVTHALIIIFLNEAKIKIFQRNLLKKMIPNTDEIKILCGSFVIYYLNGLILRRYLGDMGPGNISLYEYILKLSNIVNTFTNLFCQKFSIKLTKIKDIKNEFFDNNKTILILFLVSFIPYIMISKFILSVLNIYVSDHTKLLLAINIITIYFGFILNLFVRLALNKNENNIFLKICLVWLISLLFLLYFNNSSLIGFFIVNLISIINCCILYLAVTNGFKNYIISIIQTLKKPISIMLLINCFIFLLAADISYIVILNLITVCLSAYILKYKNYGIIQNK